MKLHSECGCDCFYHSKSTIAFAYNLSVHVLQSNMLYGKYVGMFCQAITPLSSVYWSTFSFNTCGIWRASCCSTLGIQRKWTALSSEHTIVDCTILRIDIIEVPLTSTKFLKVFILENEEPYTQSLFTYTRLFVIILWRFMCSNFVIRQL